MLAITTQLIHAE